MPGILANGETNAFATTTTAQYLWAAGLKNTLYIYDIFKLEFAKTIFFFHFSAHKNFVAFPTRFRSFPTPSPSFQSDLVLHQVESFTCYWFSFVIIKILSSWLDFEISGRNSM